MNRWLLATWLLVALIMMGFSIGIGGTFGAVASAIWGINVGFLFILLVVSSGAKDD